MRVRHLLLAFLTLVLAGSLTLAPSPAQAAFPGKNGRLAFQRETVAGDHTQTDIFTIRSHGSGLTALTSTPDENEFGPAWNRTGTSIAFWRTPAPFGPGSIWTMNGDGTNQRRLTTGVDARDPVWNPAGTRIAFTLVDATGFHLWTMRVADGGDRTRIVFERDLAASSSIYSVNADGTHLTALTSGPFFDTGPAFSPDGRYIAFGSDRGGAVLSDLWTMRSDGRHLHRILSSPASEGFPDWQPLLRGRQ